MKQRETILQFNISIVNGASQYLACDGCSVPQMDSKLSNVYETMTVGQRLVEAIQLCHSPPHEADPFRGTRLLCKLAVLHVVLVHQLKKNEITGEKTEKVGES